MRTWPEVIAHPPDEEAVYCEKGPRESKADYKKWLSNVHFSGHERKLYNVDYVLSNVSSVQCAQPLEKVRLLIFFPQSTVANGHSSSTP